MFPTQARCAKKNLLLCFDAFGTLFKPNTPIPQAYAEAAIRHGIKCTTKSPAADVGTEFKRAFKGESKRSPNYGKATGLGAEKWWSNIIQSTFQRWLEPGQEVPKALVDELLHRYSTKEGYDIFPDVNPFFDMLREHSCSEAAKQTWPWNKTVVGIITNSDARVPGILESFGLKIGPRRVGTPDQRTAEAALEDDINFVVLSYDVGVEKPNRAIFDAAVNSFKETLAGTNDDVLKADNFERLYIGDDLKNDYSGAKQARWHAILLDRAGDYEKHFSRNGKDIVQTTVTLGTSESVAKVMMIKSLEALSSWQPNGSGESSPSPTGSEKESAGLSSPETKPDEKS